MNNLPRVLVTGGGGFVCRNIINVMLAAGWHVVAVDRSFDSSLQHEWHTNWDSQIELIETNAETLPLLTVDALIHGAALTASPEQARHSPEDNFRANLEPLLGALEWAEQQQVRRSIYISSGAVFRRSAAGPIPEDSAATPLGLYAVAKHTMESLVETLHAIYHRDVVAIRLGNIYGPGELSRATRPRISLIGQMVNSALQDGEINIQNASVSGEWTFAPDVGHAIMALIARPQLNYSLYHVASGQQHTQAEIAETIREILPTTRVQSTNVAPVPLEKLGYLSHERLLQDVGFARWTSLKEGLSQTIAHHRNT